LLANNPLVLGARLAGEEGVKSVAPKAKQPAKKPAPVKPAVIREQPKAQERVVPKQKITQGKKVLRKQESDKRYVTIDFDNVDIVLFIKFISELTGKNFVVDKGVRGKVTIISPTKISAKEAYKVFESVLEVHGFTTVPAGKIIKIVPAIHARSKNIETRLREEAISPEDKVVTQLIPLDYANPDELKKLFAPLIKSFNDIFQAQARRRPKKGAPAGPVIRIVADERTNSLIILATEDDAFRVKELVKLLDKPIPRGEGDIHVYYLQNANACSPQRSPDRSR
jgi:general secretion pathway protein D